MDSKIKMVEKALEAIVRWSVAYKETHAAREMAEMIADFSERL